MSHNLAVRSKEERDKINVALAASDVAFKERLDLPVFAMEVQMQQPEDLREYFKEHRQHYRNIALQLLRGSDPVYQKGEK